MLSTLTDWLFGCSHRHTSFPITRRTAVSIDGQTHRYGSETYVVCLDCGKRFAYDWSAMRIAKQPAVVGQDTGAQRRGTENPRSSPRSDFSGELVHPN